MTEGIIIALITGGLTAVSTIIAVVVNNTKTLLRIDILEKKVEKHNNLVEKVYGIEKQIEVQGERIKVVNHRIDDLEEIK